MKLVRHYFISRRAFSLVEVVIALGVVSFAVIAILGLLPTGLQTSHGAQDETRAGQIAQAIIAALDSQSQTQFSSLSLPLDDNTTASFDLTQAQTITLYADNDGKLSQSAATAVYKVTATTNPAPAGFDAGYANEVTLTVAWPASAAAANQTKRDFVRIVSKY